MASDLISKLLAAGLSAGLFLIWWPEHHATAGLASLILRGALWTLTYELLLLAFTPLERLARHAVAARAHRLRRPNPFSAVPAPARVGGACVLACVGAALPLTLLAGARGPRPARAAATTTKRVVVVKRPVVKRVVVRETVTVPAAAAHPSPPVIVRAATASRTTKTPTHASTRRSTPTATKKRTTPLMPAPSPATSTATPPATTAPAAAAAPQAEAAPAG